MNFETIAGVVGGAIGTTIGALIYRRYHPSASELQNADLLLAELRWDVQLDMEEQGYHLVGLEGDFADPTSTLVEVDDESIVVIHAAGRFYALDDICTHDGGPLSDGPLHCEDEQPAIACPRHGAKFALADGDALTMPATKPTRAHDVKVQDGQVFVKLNEG